MRNPYRLARRAAAGGVAAVVTLLACDEAGISSFNAFVDYRLEVTPSAININDGGQTQLKARIVDPNGTPLSSAMEHFDLEWSVADPGIVEVSGTGPDVVVHAIAPGSTEIELEATPRDASAAAELDEPLTHSITVNSRPVPTELLVHGGNGQQGIVGRTLGASVVVRLLDRHGNPIMGSRVDFTVQPGDQVTPGSAQTDIGGYASAVWTLGSDTGVHVIEAKSTGVQAVSAEAMATFAPAAALSVVSGSGQQAPAGQAFGSPLRVRALDDTGDPVPGATVTWTVLTGGGSISPATSTTDSEGRATATWTAGGSTGTQTARAAIGGLTAAFSATVSPGAAAQIIQVSGAGQTANVGTTLPDSLVVRVLDAFGNRVPGATVTWTVTGGNGTVSPTQAVTSSIGQARTSWRVGTNPGNGSVRASVSGAGNVTFASEARTPDAPPPPPPSVVRVVLTPATLALDALGAQSSLTANAYNGSNQVVPGTQMNWTTTNASVATVDSNGRVTAVAVGTALVIAKAACCTAADTTTVTVTQRIASIAVSPRTLALQTGSSADLSITARDANSNVVASPSITWSSSSNSVATVSQGRVTAVSAGTAVIRAVSGSVRDSAIVTVQNPAPQVSRVVATPATAALDAIGAQVTLSALAYNASNQVVPGAVVRWRTLEASIATVDSTTGVVTARAIGTARVVAKASCCNPADTVTVTVTQRVASLAVAPRTLALQIGSAGDLTITARDANNNVIASPSITWSSSSNATATVSQGRVTAVAAGTAVIRAVSGTVRDSATVTVQAAPPQVDHVVATPATAALDAIGAQVTLSAQAFNASNQVVPGVAVRWRTLEASIATVDSITGVVTARAVGTARMVAKASCCNPADTVTVTVTQRVASVAVAPRTLSLQVGSAGDLAVTARDANNNVIASPSITWSSSSNATATVSQGRVTAVAAGTAVIRAVSGTVRDSATVTVQAAPPLVDRVVITPATASLTAIGAQVTLSAQAFNSSNQVVAGAQIGWRSLNTTLATVDSMGRVTARAVGTALIVATALCCGDADTTGIVITQSVASLDVSPGTLNLTVGGNGTASATARDANSNVIPSPPLTWSSSNTAIATVNQNGQVSAVAAGSARIRAVSGAVRDSLTVNVTSSSPPPSSNLANECANPQPGWIWCDDFAQNRLSSYFEVDNAGGRFARENNVGVDGSYGMRATFASGQSGAGSLKLAFGPTPTSYFRPVDAGTTKYREVYWRLFVRNEPGWTGGGGDKLSRAIVFANSSWAEAAIGHVWSGGQSNNNQYLMTEAASGTNAQGTLQTTQYNDFANLRWIGSARSNTAVFSAGNVGEWYCVEARMRLNDAGQSNGVLQMWIDGNVETNQTGLNWLGTYNAYGINALFVENFWNDGSPKQQSRFIDNLVVSTQRIGCGTGGGTTPPPPPPPPPPTSVASVTVTPASASLAVGSTQQLAVTLRDASGSTLTGRTVSWTSNNTTVATVSTSGVVTARAQGNATVTAMSEGVTGSSSITVTGGSSGSPTPWMVEDFSSYTGVAQFLSDPRSIYNRSEDINSGRMEIDNTIGYGGSGQSLRYTYPSGTGTDYTISRTLRLSGAQEVWIEAAVRFSPTFTLEGNGQSAGSAFKLMHVAITGPAGRFGVNMEGGNNSVIRAEGPNDNYDGMYIMGKTSNRTLFDGNWHIVRYHVRIGSSDTHEFWVDGVHQGSKSGNTSANSLVGVSMAKNLNKLPGAPQSMWWGKVSIWTQNPGW